MTAEGWLIMVFSVGAVTLLLGFCIWKVFKKDRSE